MGESEPLIRVGVDLADVAAVAHAVACWGDRYTRRVFTQGELRDCAGDPTSAARSLAARFAAKESVMKVLGDGPWDATDVPLWSEIEVRRSDEGTCRIGLSGTARSWAARAGLGTWAVSLTHESTMAAAVVVATS